MSAPLVRYSGLMLTSKLLLCRRSGATEEAGVKAAQKLQEPHCAPNGNRTHCISLRYIPERARESSNGNSPQPSEVHHMWHMQCASRDSHEAEPRSCAEVPGQTSCTVSMNNFNRRRPGSFELNCLLYREKYIYMLTNGPLESFSSYCDGICAVLSWTSSHLEQLLAIF